MKKNAWYNLETPDIADSPALLVYPDRISYNIDKMISIVGTPDRLAPHVKTHKMSSIVNIQLEKGIRNFVAATISETEMLAKSGASNILLAYQLDQPKAIQFSKLVNKFKRVIFNSLVDNLYSAEILNSIFGSLNLTSNVYIDIDNGMHRTGFPMNEDIVLFYEKLISLPHIHVSGFHIYDGHITDRSYKKRKIRYQETFFPVLKAIKRIKESGFLIPEIIAGGTPTFLFHALNNNIVCSPGTPVLWDGGYNDLLPEMPFLNAAVLLTRIVSKPVKRIITTDLGYKSVSSENRIDRRIYFLNLENYKILSQDEEHLSLKVSKTNWEELRIGEVLYGIPFHICPTVALYDKVQVVRESSIVCQWQVDARK